MDFKRVARHLLRLPQRLPASALQAIEQAIAAGEASHRGEIRFAAEDALDARAVLAGQSARERAIDVFSELRVWDTEENSGVLIYLLLADRDVEIVADRGIAARVDAVEWEAICRGMEQGLRRGDVEGAVVGGVQAVSRLLARHFPGRPGDRNELPDRPVTV
jgi:uncharacterized membrane protein